MTCAVCSAPSTLLDEHDRCPPCQARAEAEGAAAERGFASDDERSLWVREFQACRPDLTVSGAAKQADHALRCARELAAHLEWPGVPGPR